MGEMAERELILRVAPRPADININGHIFGGWILSQMDIAGGIAAASRARGKVATVAVDRMQFHRPILLGDLLSIYATVDGVRRSSMAIHIEAIARRRGAAEEITVTEGVFTFVALDAEGRPRPVDEPPGDAADLANASPLV